MNHIMKVKLRMKGRVLPDDKIGHIHEFSPDRLLVSLSSGTVYLSGKSEERLNDDTNERFFDVIGQPVLRRTYPVIGFLRIDGLPNCVIAAFEDGDLLLLFKHDSDEGSTVRSFQPTGSFHQPTSEFTAQRILILSSSALKTDAEGDLHYRTIIALADETGRCRFAELTCMHFPKELKEGNGKWMKAILDQFQDTHQSWLSPPITSTNNTENTGSKFVSDYPIQMYSYASDPFELDPMFLHMSTTSLSLCRMGKPIEHKWQKENQVVLLVTKQHNENIVQAVRLSNPTSIKSDTNVITVAVLLQSLQLIVYVLDRKAIMEGEWVTILELTANAREIQSVTGDKAQPFELDYTKKIREVTLMSDFDSSGRISFSIQCDEELHWMNLSSHPVEVPVVQNERFFDEVPVHVGEEEDIDGLFDTDNTDIEERPTTAKGSPSKPLEEMVEREASRKTDRIDLNDVTIASLLRRIEQLEEAQGARELIGAKVTPSQFSKKQQKQKAAQRGDPLVEVPGTVAIGGFPLCNQPTVIDVNESQLKQPPRHYGRAPVYGDLGHSLAHYARVQAYLDKPHPVIDKPAGGIHRVMDDHVEQWSVLLDANHMGHVSLHMDVDTTQVRKMIHKLSWVKGRPLDFESHVFTLQDLRDIAFPLKHLTSSKLYVSYNPPRRGPDVKLLANEFGGDMAALGPRGVFLSKKPTAETDLFTGRDDPERTLRVDGNERLKYLCIAKPQAGTVEEASWQKSLPIGQSLRTMSAGSSFVAYVLEPSNLLTVVSNEGRTLHVEKLQGSIVSVVAREQLLMVMTSNGPSSAFNYLKMDQLHSGVREAGNPSTEEFLFQEYMRRPGAIAHQSFQCTLMDFERSRHSLVWEGRLAISGYDGIRWMGINPLGIPVVLTYSDEILGLCAALNRPDVQIEDFADRCKRVNEEYKPMDTTKLIRRWVPFGSLQYLTQKTSQKTPLQVVRYNLGICQTPSTSDKKVFVPIECGVSDLKLLALSWSDPGDIYHARTAKIHAKGKTNTGSSMSHVSICVPFMVPSFNLMEFTTDGNTDTNGLHPPLHRVYSKLTNDLLQRLAQPFEHAGVYPIDMKTNCKSPELIHAMELTYKYLYMQSLITETDKGSFDTYKAHAGAFFPWSNYENDFGDSLEGGDDSAYDCLKKTQDTLKGQSDSAIKRELNCMMKRPEFKPMQALCALRSYGPVETMESLLPQWKQNARLRPLYEGVVEEIQTRHQRRHVLHEMSVDQVPMLPTNDMSENMDPWNDEDLAQPKKRMRHE